MMAHGRKFVTCFNSRAREGRDGMGLKSSRAISCFNSRAREGRDWKIPRARGVVIVSIHAPARGATSRHMSTSTRGCCFNSRAREGRDRRDKVRLHRVRQFQFTRPRGARRYLFGAGVAVATFQFTRPRGARPTSFVISKNFLVSIHAPARGATQGPARGRRRYARFNSRAREGRDDLRSSAISTTTQFQFTRPRGARP